jgi:N-acetylneuraminic acid mutarotase
MQERMFRSKLISVVLTSSAILLSGCGGSGGTTNSGGGGGTTPPTTSLKNAWTWMSGADQDIGRPANVPGPGNAPYNSDPYYGTLGVAGPINIPGGRNSSSYWTDKNGNFWLFGGDGLDGSDAPVEGLLNDLWEYSPATNEWTWMGGSSTISPVCPLGPGQCGVAGVYGTQGTPSATNVPGGRKLAANWTDSAGNLWLFGGYGMDGAGGFGYLNDLWEFNPSTKQWTWISGSNSVGSNGSGQAGNFGMQGVAAVANVPPGLEQATAWADQNGNLWLFGGSGVDVNGGGNGALFNTLWEFTIATGEWTWMGGAGRSGGTAVSGTAGTAAAGNIPSARQNATGWTDPSGNMWLFGGYGRYAPFPNGLGGGENDLNDLWEFNPTSKQWTWVGGSLTGVLNAYNYAVPPSGSYGALGIASSSNVPGGRDGANGWVDGSGNLWFFGGEGDDSTGSYGPMNDLWKFSPAAGQWTWMGGSNVAWQGATYGTEGTPALANIPGARYNSATWKDSDGNFWIFAGWGILVPPAGGSTILNDLWRYQP